MSFTCPSQTTPFTSSTTTTTTTTSSASSDASSSPWHALPAEMKLSIVDLVSDEPGAIDALAQVDVRTYRACVHAKFKTVTLRSYEAIERFLENVPREYLSYIQTLDINTSHLTPRSTPVLSRIRADTVIRLLGACTRLHRLVLRLNGSLDKSVVCCFSHLHCLREVEIRNVGDEIKAPVSERLVVAIACTIPHLTSLTLDKITRSKLHAPELDGVFPCPPLCINDTDIPIPSSLPPNTPLSLPSLLRLHTLRNLVIKDTHLGDPGWTTTPVGCRLEVLDIGSCYHSASEFNTLCTERIMAAVGPSVHSFSLATPITSFPPPLPTSHSSFSSSPIPTSPNSIFSSATHTPLPKLRKLHISPFFPVGSVVETMKNLQGSPVENISVQCFEEDVVDVCAALGEFLSLKQEKKERFYASLKRIDVCVAADPFANEDDEDESEEGEDGKREEDEERLEATRKLQDFCRDLQLQSMVDKLSRKSSTSAAGHGANNNEKRAPVSFVDAKRYATKGRSNTL